MNQDPYASVRKHMLLSTEQLKEPYWTASDETHLSWFVTSTPRGGQGTVIPSRLGFAARVCRCLTCLCCCLPSGALLQLLFWTLSRSQPNPPGWPCWPSLQNSAQMGHGRTAAKKHWHEAPTCPTLAHETLFFIIMPVKVSHSRHERRRNCQRS